MWFRVRSLKWPGIGLAAWVTMTASAAFAQAVPDPAPPGAAPAPAPAEVAPAPAPPVPSPAVPPPAGVAAPPASTREAELEDRVRQLEQMVNSLSTQVKTMATAPARPPAGPGSTTPDRGSPASNVTPSQSGGASAPGQSLPPNPPASPRFNSPATLENRAGSVKFGPGFEIKTNDNEFFLQFHDLTQFDYRGYTQGGQTPVHDTFVIPRQWWMFSGRITRPIGYFLSFANGFDTISMLDVFIDLNYNPKLQFRIGRYKTPFTYEFLVEPIQGLMTGERSLFFNNFGLNRDLGIMAYGRLLDNKLDYAVAIQNGTRNGFLSTNDQKDVAAFVNYKPFGDEENTLLENLNIGGSVLFGDQFNTPVPQTFRTAVATTGNQTIGVPFLTLNNNVRESGVRSLWDLHAAYFYRQLAVIGEWGSGFQDYALQGGPGGRTRLPVNSFYVQAGYLLTGETRSSIGIVKPFHPFNPRLGEWGWGAWELVGRYNYLDIGSQVFSHGLADPNAWANRVSMVDVGINWHLTQYLKLYLDWQHASYNNPVIFAPGRRQTTSDMLWARLQLYF